MRLVFVLVYPIMKARHAARELALLTLFQVVGKEEANEHFPRWEKHVLRDLMFQSISALEDEAREKLQLAIQQWQAVSQQMMTYEAEHPDNLALAMDAENLPVPIPTSKEMLDRLDECLQAAEYITEAMEIPRFAALARAEEVQNFANRLIRLVCEHHAVVDELLNQHLEDWRVDRLAKMDRLILRLAVTEMKYIEEIDLSVSINEAVVLAKRFSSLESFKLINGVLGKLALVFEGKVATPPEHDSLFSPKAAEEPTVAEGATHV